MASTPCPFKLPLIAILRGIRPDEALAHVGALVEEGFDAIEIPLNSPQPMDSIGAALTQFGDRAWIGAGTVLHAEQATELAQLGARFIVTPNTAPALIAHATAQGLQVAAGFATASEGFAALDAGASMLKLFPASVYGPGMIRALRAVLPPAPLFAVGGIGPDALPTWLDAGCTGAGIGGELYRPSQTPQATRDNARAFVQAYRKHTS